MVEFDAQVEAVLEGALNHESWNIRHVSSNAEALRSAEAEPCDLIITSEKTSGRDDIELVEVDSDFFRDDFSSKRPRSEIMRNMTLDLQGMNLMRPWPDALEEYLENHFHDLMHYARTPAAV